MKLTKDQRFTIYVVMLGEAENPRKVEHPSKNGSVRATTENGLCWLYKMIVGDEELYYHYELLPELTNHKDEDWWSSSPVDWELRINILKQCIIETSDF